MQPQQLRPNACLFNMIYVFLIAAIRKAVDEIICCLSADFTIGLTIKIYFVSMRNELSWSIHSP